MKIINEFTINLAKGRTIQDVIRASKYDEINPLVIEGVQKKRLSLNNEDLGVHQIVIIGTDENISSNDVLAVTRKLGLIRPNYGDAFLFGEQYPDEQITGPIIFLHDPQYIWSGYSFNLALDVNEKGRLISLVSSGGWWHNKFRFAFRKKS